MRRPLLFLAGVLLISGCAPDAPAPPPAAAPPDTVAVAPPDGRKHDPAATGWTPIDPDTIRADTTWRWHRDIRGVESGPGYVVRYAQASDSSFALLWGRERADRRLKAPLYVAGSARVPRFAASTPNWIVVERQAGTGRWTVSGALLPLGAGKARWIPLPLAVSAEHELVAYPDQISGDEAAPMGVMVQRLAGGPAQIVAVLPEASPFIADELEARFDGCTVEVSAPEGFEGPTFRSRTTLRSSLCPD